MNINQNIQCSHTLTASLILLGYPTQGWSVSRGSLHSYKGLVRLITKHNTSHIFQTIVDTVEYYHFPQRMTHYIYGLKATEC